MKVFKIILGFILVFSASHEYVSMSRQLGTYFPPAGLFMSFIFIILAALLLTSGMSKNGLRLRSWENLQYFAIALIAFVCFAASQAALLKPAPPAEIVNTNGFKINITNFKKELKSSIPDDRERTDFCTCIVTKLVNDKNIVAKYPRELKAGNIDDIVAKVRRKDSVFYISVVQECASILKGFQWTPEFEKAIRDRIFKEYGGTDFTKTNSLPKYCNCLIEAYKTVPFQILTSKEFAVSQERFLIDSACTSKSKLNSSK